MDCEDKARRLTDCYGARVMQCLRAMLGNAEDAEDLWVDAFEICSRKTLTLKDQNSEQAYVMKVTKRLALRRMSLNKGDRQRRFLVSEMAPGQWDSIRSPGMGPNVIDEVEQLTMALNKLDWKSRYVVVCTYILRDSDSEIAAALRMKESSVRATRARALAHIRKWLHAISKEAD